MTKPMRYVSLHGHSTFSTGDGHGLPIEHGERAVELGMKALGLSEHGNVSSWAALEAACEKLGIEPIFGIEIYYGRPKVQAKTHMILIAMNEVGLRNINRIVTQSWKQFYYSPTVYHKDLERWNEGVIALSGCADSALSCELLGGKWFGPKTLEPEDGAIQRATRAVRRFQKIFGDRYYLEVQRFPGLERTCALNPILAQISRDTGVSLVATADVHYCQPEQNAIQRILHAAHRGKDVETADAGWEYDILLTYPRSDREIIRDLQGTGLSIDEAKEAVLTTERIAQRCKGLRLPKAPLPRYRDDNGFVDNPKELLSQWISEGWKIRLEYNPVMRSRIKEYKERMRHEYEVICAAEGFADYFLIVADLIRWAKSQEIAVGPGRGSAAGSLICYLLQITEIDALQYPVLFERFLDASRTDPPDIDIDFEDDRRDEVFTYAASKYGSEYVANIGTSTRYKGKNSIDDIARVYHVPKWIAEAVKSKLIEREEGHPRFSKTLEDTFNTFPEVANLVKQRPELNYGKELERNLRSFGVHAAGMVISSVPITDISAIYEREIGTTGRVGQAIPYDKRDAAKVGFLKIDALSLTTMGEIARICHMAGIKLSDLYRIPLNDKPTLEGFRKGDVMGIFQFEGNTTRRILRKVQPEHIMHLSDVNALARPGADDKGYVANKDSGQLPTFAHPIIAHHTTEWPNTYGVLTYEEQILSILRDIGGFDPAELNKMRKIIHDKLGSTSFNEYFRRFVKGAAAHNLNEDTAKSIWDGMVSASGYAFNTAHSVAYAHIGYWQQYLKIHHPAEFYTTKLSKCPTNENGLVRRGKFIQEAERHGIEVTPPNIIDSQRDWNLTKIDGKSTIVAGFEAIDGIGPATSKSIIEWRDRIIEESDIENPWELYELMDWDDLLEVKGIGEKTIRKIKNFVEDDDPFGVQKVSRTIKFVKQLNLDLPKPTHVSIDIPPDEQFVCYIGILRGRKYSDEVEGIQKRSTEDLSYDEALQQVSKDRHLLKKVALYVEDEYGEQVRIAVNRWKYPTFEAEISEAKIGRDVVIVQGTSSDFGGVSINRVKQLAIINPERY